MLFQLLFTDWFNPRNQGRSSICASLGFKTKNTPRLVCERRSSESHMGTYANTDYFVPQLPNIFAQVLLQPQHFIKLLFLRARRGKDPVIVSREACAANPGFQPTVVGGDGNLVQIFFVGFWPDQNSIVVAHEGTDPTQLFSDLTDADILMGSLDTKLFPGVSSGVEVHEGFRNEHETTALTILAEVKRLMSVTGSRSVVTIGHSLGGALAELDALFLTLNLPSSTSIKAVTYGTPRVGNPAFAQLIDTKVPEFRRINNEKDIIPIVPGRFLGFQHPHGEVHILSPGNAVSCSGDDDATDLQCQIESVPDIFSGNILNHLGPYEGISLGTIFCT